MPLGLGAQMGKGGIVKSIPSHVTDNLKMLHRYNTGSVVPVSDGAVYCDGSTYVDCGTGIGTALGDNYAGDLTVSMWFKANATTGVGLFQSGNESHNNREFSLRLNSDKIEFGLNNIGWQKTVAFTDTSNWHHVAAVLDNGSESTSLLYLDGVSVGSVEGGSSFPTASNLDFNGDDTHIGRFYNSEFNGYICNVGIWTGVLTQAQIKSIMWKNYSGLIDSEKTNLKGWWNLDSTLTTNGSKVWTPDNNDLTFGSNITPTWSANNGSPTVDGQVITLPQAGIQSVSGTVTAGVHKVNVTVTNYTGSGSIEMPWDGSSSSNMLISANGTYEFYEDAGDDSWSIYAQDGAGCTVTVNSIYKANGNIGKLV